MRVWPTMTISLAARYLDDILRNSRRGRGRTAKQYSSVVILCRLSLSLSSSILPRTRDTVSIMHPEDVTSARRTPDINANVDARRGGNRTVSDRTVSLTFHEPARCTIKSAVATPRWQWRTTNVEMLLFKFARGRTRIRGATLHAEFHFTRNPCGKARRRWTSGNLATRCFYQRTTE